MSQAVVGSSVNGDMPLDWKHNKASLHICGIFVGIV